ncbi:MAG: Rrf2 family transcriptional regulator [Elusimicrobia bacterium]|nr:Rrf2 family transcriptional regulator [Elusimicrobiota bacterium]
MSALAALGPPDGAFRLVGAVARRTGLPKSSLAKSLQALARAGLLESRRGPRGGYRLAARAAGATLAELIEAFGYGAGGGECMIEARPCDTARPCRLHAVVEACDRLLRADLSRTRLSELASAAETEPAAAAGRKGWGRERPAR